MQAEALNAKFNPVLRHIGDGKMSHASKADHFEAFVGAMLLTRGFDATSAYLSPLLLPWVERISLSPGFHDRYRTPAAMIRAKQAQRAQAKALAERAAKSGLLTKVLRRVFGPMLRWIFPEVSTIVQKGRPKR
ncbi:Ribonuclease III domain [Ceraceosorus bombacis]|uniref:Ribonuclease III domain n=1 Tax=Ceraceosorus bombacis TaxID=401625 RepID=A0A0P1BDM9_9BASI|nr:Ribonuclease III domain [Ceraceosorus bombacis]